MAEEYIKKEDAIQSVVNHDLLKDEWSRDWAEYMLENAPTIDAVPRADYEELERHFVNWEPVVRCKDCRWFGKIGCAIEVVDETDMPKENDFCSFAERKDDE